MSAILFSTFLLLSARLSDFCGGSTTASLMVLPAEEDGSGLLVSGGSQGAVKATTSLPGDSQVEVKATTWSAIVQKKQALSKHDFTSMIF